MHDETEGPTASDALDDPERPIPFPPELRARAVDRLDELETLAALNEALAEVDRGEGSSIKEAEARLREKLGVQQRVQ